MATPEYYEIHIEGNLSHKWSDWFAGLKIIQGPENETILTGKLQDQADLHGVLMKIRVTGYKIQELISQYHSPTSTRSILQFYPATDFLYLLNVQPATNEWPNASPGLCLADPKILATLKRNPRSRWNIMGDKMYSMGIKSPFQMTKDETQPFLAGLENKYQMTHFTSRAWTESYI